MEFTPHQNDTVLLEKQDNGLAIITLNRPDRYNGANKALFEGLTHAMQTTATDDSVRAIVLRGSGRGFCAGADLENFAPGASADDMRDYMLAAYRPLFDSFIRNPKPILAAIHGSAAGIGAALALVCDLRIMADTANLRYAFINIGLGPDGGAGWLLARQVGYARAFEIAVSGDKLPAARCETLGLVNRVVPEAELEAKAMEWGAQLAARPTLAVGITKAALQHSFEHGFLDTVDFESVQQHKAFQSEDFAEGVMAFLQKRKPNFKGK